MTPTRSRILALALALLVCGAVLLMFWGGLASGFQLVGDRARIRDYLAGFGPWAPGVFVLAQVLQVAFAPIPGEATGFIGGYLFGVLPGFVLSSIGLTIGSGINFAVGRLLGIGFVRKMIPGEKFERMNAVVKRQGLLVIAALFLFPGFPKDFLCLFLGVTGLSAKLFLIIAAVGRMPGTLALSVQGALLFEGDYTALALVACVSLAVMGLLYRYRERLYRWAERFNSHAPPPVS